ncbi:hypothetical protein [Microseira wollei]|nr:hypothetical protein [Microseira wollei]
MPLQNLLKQKHGVLQSLGRNQNRTYVTPTDLGATTGGLPLQNAIYGCSA